MYFFDKVLSLLDSANGRAAVISASCDWSEAFDRQSPKIITCKLIGLNLRPSIMQLLISYMTDREMRVKWKVLVSNPRALIGGTGQGTRLGGSRYLAASSDAASSIPGDRK